MIRRKGFCFYLPRDLIKLFPWRNKSEFVEVSVIYVLDQLKTDPALKERMVLLRDLKRDGK